MSRKGSVVHLSSVHHISDTRVFYKECSSLAAAGYDVTLIINTDNGDEVRNGVRIRSLSKSTGGRFARMMRRPIEVFRMARQEDAQIYHFHDPELIPVGVALKVIGKRVVYDAHEHVAKQILSKGWLPRLLRRPLSLGYRALEWLCVNFVFDAVVVADPTQIPLYPEQKVVVVENFPLLSEIVSAPTRPYDERSNRVTYIGAITELRGAREMVEAIRLVNLSMDATLSLGGRFSPPNFQENLEGAAGWEFVDYRGFLDRDAVFDLLSDSRVGIVVLHPIPNYLTSQPVKLLEYMLAGLPVVVANFPYYRQYVEDTGSGIMVDPLNPVEIATAITWLLENPIEAERMGERGKRVVLDRYNWEHEAEKIINLYRSIA